MNFHSAEKPAPGLPFSPCRFKTKHKTGITLLLFFSFFSFSLAQETPPLTNYTSSVYKAHKQNWAIDQSSDGIIYAANSDGLLEYDGASWKVYPLPNQQIVRTVLCDEVPIRKPGPGEKLANHSTSVDKRIYAGGYGEFGFFQPLANGQLRYHSLSTKTNFPSLKTEEIWHITKTPQYIYFQSFSRIYRYDGQNVVEIKGKGNFMFLRYVNGRILVQMIGKGLFELRDKQFLPLPGTETLATSTVASILPFSKNRILIATAKHGLYIWKDGQMSSWRIPLSKELEQNIINKAIRLSHDSSYAIGTIQKGVYIISADGALKYHLKKESGLQNNTVLALAEDSRKQVWVGLDQGIDLIKTSSPYISYQTNDNPLGSTYAAAIWRGNLYVGSNNGVFVKKWMSAEPFRSVPGLGGQTWNLKVINDQLICGHNDATFRIDHNGAVRIADITGGWVLMPITNGSDTLLLQGAYNGLHIYKKDLKNLWAYAYPVKGIPPLPIRQIARDTNGSFWLGHAYKGLYRAELSAKMDTVLKWNEYKSPGDIASEFSVDITSWKNRITIRSSNKFFEPDATGRLLPSKDLGNEVEDTYKIRNGIAGDWFKVYMNQVRLYAPEKQTITLDLTLVRNSETIIPLSDRYYFFCLENGYALFDRSLNQEQEINKIKPVIRKVANLRNLAETFATADGQLLPADTRSIRITYALPAYGQNIQYKYRLKGLSDQWSEWTEQSFVEFTNLESSSYAFELQSSLNNETTVYSFSVNPYWYETILAKILFAVLIVLILISLLIYQEKRLARHRRRLLEEQEEKLRQQKLSSERKIMEIQNEKLQSEIKSKSQQISNVAINVVRKNEILEEIRDELKQVKLEMGTQLPNIHYQKLLQSIERNVAGKEDWQLFEENFNEVHELFFKRLRVICPAISPSELRLAACLRMNLSTKEMAPALGISIRGVEIKRYRLRKKLGLGLDANLVQYMMDI
jgi:ligand-binding sensor domain-containing protein/DNA-binding CsgD family transcriptional regulator